MVHFFSILPIANKQLSEWPDHGGRLILSWLFPDTHGSGFQSGSHKPFMGIKFYY
jgi:hypothetical protein